jgi:enoyl-[acyl-carrier-protein] reductase (NADH)
MRVVVFGVTGTVGRAIEAELSQRHEIIGVGRSSGEHRADVTKPESLETLFKAIGRVDALVCATGKVHFGPLATMSPALFNVGLQDKLMGQVNVVLQGQQVLNDRGSITLSSGILTDEPIRAGSGASMANGALEAFVRAAATELPRGIRINVVSASVLTESIDAYGAFFRGFESVPARRVALAYTKSVEGAQTGQIYRVR